MDYILAALVRRVRARNLHLSYDIICQYSKNLVRRMSEIDGDTPFVQVGAEKLMYDIHTTFAVPKFHNPGHKPLCQQWFNLAFQLYTGQTDGEASERAWAGLNRAAASIREMGPGHMRDTIDFYCGTWNWRKFVNMGTRTSNARVSIVPADVRTGNFLENKIDIDLREEGDN